MLEAPLPLNEAERLAALRRLQILDTPAEERFDRITRLASRLFNLPVALVSLTDENRQWFKSCQGLEVSEAPRAISFCGHAILQDEALVIKDALADLRFNDNPLVIGEPFIRFYVGQPLKDSQGYKLGTLCLMDHQPNRFSESDLASLRDLALMVEQELNQQQLNQAIRRVRDSEVRLHTVLNNIQDGVIVFDRQGLARQLNRAAEGLFGYSAAEMVGQSFTRFLAEPYDQEYQGYLEQYLSKNMASIGRQIREVFGQHRSGRTFPMELSVGHLKLEDSSQFLAVVRDISERQRLEKMKSDFIALVSHELRTPLSNIQSSWETLKEGIAGELPVEAQAVVELGYRNGERLSRLVNSIVEVAGLEAGKVRFNMRRLDLLELVQQQVAQQDSYARERAVKLALKAELTDVKVMGDWERLSQVVANLLSNAIRHSPVGGLVQVLLTCGESPQTVRVTITDQGGGISNQGHSEIFKPFTLASAKPQNGRLGLGLALGREIVAQHEGWLNLGSTSDRGTTFYLELPKA